MTKKKFDQAMLDQAVLELEYNLNHGSDGIEKWEHENNKKLIKYFAICLYNQAIEEAAINIGKFLDCSTSDIEQIEANVVRYLKLTGKGE